MANRWDNQFALSLEKRVTSVFARVAFGASGAPTISVVNSKGVLSVTRSSAGKYVFVFGSLPNGRANLDTYVKILDVNCVFNTVATAAAPAAPGIYIAGDTTNSPATAALTVQLTSAAGAATDPASGEIGYFEFTFGDSTAP